MSETRRPNGGPTYEQMAERYAPGVDPTIAQMIVPVMPRISDESEADDD